MFEILGIIVFCVLSADLITGHAHWAEDAYCTDNTKNNFWLHIVGKHVCDPNIEHHLLPNQIADSPFFVRNWVTFVIAGVASLAAFLLGFSWPVLLTIVLSGFANEVHTWNHIRDADMNSIQRFFRDAGLIQSKQQHMKHHKPPYMNNYCVMISFNNAWMDRIGYWRFLEKIVEKTIRIKPRGIRNGIGENNGKTI